MACYITTSDDLDIIMYLGDGMQFVSQKIQLLFLLYLLIYYFLISSIRLNEA